VSVRERAEHLITLAAKAVDGPWFFDGYCRVGSEPRLEASNKWDTENDYSLWENDDPRWKTEPRYLMAKTENVTTAADDGEPHGDLGTVDGIANGEFIAAARNDAPEVARQLLEALNRIEAAKALHWSTAAYKRLPAVCHNCGDPWPCATWLALNPKEADE
jgi:hypothetical protein